MCTHLVKSRDTQKNQTGRRDSVAVPVGLGAAETTDDCQSDADERVKTVKNNRAVPGEQMTTVTGTEALPAAAAASATQPIIVTSWKSRIDHPHIVA